VKIGQAQKLPDIYLKEKRRQMAGSLEDVEEKTTWLP
jgi:hypothetical protein